MGVLPRQSSAAEKPQPKAPEAITGSSAFYKCYIRHGAGRPMCTLSSESDRQMTRKPRRQAGEWRGLPRFETHTLHMALGELTGKDAIGPTEHQIFNVHF